MEFSIGNHINMSAHDFEEKLRVAWESLRKAVEGEQDENEGVFSEVMSDISCNVYGAFSPQDAASNLMMLLLLFYGAERWGDRVVIVD